MNSIEKEAVDSQPTSEQSLSGNASTWNYSSTVVVSNLVERTNTHREKYLMKE